MEAQPSTLRLAQGFQEKTTRFRVVQRIVLLQPIKDLASESRIRTQQRFHTNPACIRKRRTVRKESNLVPILRRYHLLQTKMSGGKIPHASTAVRNMEIQVGINLSEQQFINAVHRREVAVNAARSLNQP